MKKLVTPKELAEGLVESIDEWTPAQKQEVLTTHELMDAAVRTVQQMTTEGKAKLRSALWREYLMSVKCSPVIQ